MTVRKLAAPSLAAFGLVASLGIALAGGAGEPDRGAGTSGRGDGSGMGQDNSEIGTPKGPGDKPAAATAEPAKPDAAKPDTKEQRLEGTSSEGPGMIGRCDDGRAPVNGACAR